MMVTAMQELLDIREAAEFLRVSETSLRRWTNARLLPCLRVGGKRERRFRRSDLLAFAGAQAGAAPQISRQHYCALYTSDLTRVRQAAVFTAEGLDSGTRCVLIAARGVQRAVMELLQRQRPGVRDDVKAGRLALSEYRKSPAAQIEFWVQQLGTASEHGAAPVRAVGDVSGGALGKLPLAEILEYELEYGRSIATQFPVSKLCQYDAHRLTGLAAARILEYHDNSQSYRSQH
jgi:transcriptional repressor of dcmA and dcmR